MGIAIAANESVMANISQFKFNTIFTKPALTNKLAEVAINIVHNVVIAKKLRASLPCRWYEEINDLPVADAYRGAKKKAGYLVERAKMTKINNEKPYRPPALVD